MIILLIIDALKKAEEKKFPSQESDEAAHSPIVVRLPGTGDIPLPENKTIRCEVLNEVKKHQKNSKY